MSPTSMTFAASVGIVLMCITPVFKCQNLIVGQKANENQACVDGVNHTVCSFIYRPVCAKLGTVYLQDSSPCDFCSKYGNTEALILQVGVTSNGRDFSCKELQVGDLVSDDPECVFWFGKTGCTREFRPYCATIDNFRTYVEGSNKCLFCSQYGNRDARIIGIGRAGSETCTPLKIGTRANEDIGCKYIFKKENEACTFEFSPVCAQYNGTTVQEANKCFFCSNYGDYAALIIQCPVS